MNQPVSADVSAPISRVDEARRRSLSDLIRSVRTGQIQEQSNIAGQALGELSQARQFGAQLGLQKEGLGFQRQGLAEQIRQYNQNLALEKDRLRKEFLSKRQENETASRLGKLQAEAQEPGTLDYLNTAFQGLSSAAQAGVGIKKILE